MKRRNTATEASHATLAADAGGERPLHRDTVRAYIDALDAGVYHYRDNTGLEVDAVVETAAGQWLAAEAKLGGDKAIDTAAQKNPQTA